MGKNGKDALTLDLIGQNVRGKDIKDILREKNQDQYEKVMYNVHYDNTLRYLQEELIKLQNWVIREKKRIAIIFEGRDAAGKGGAIRRFTRFLKPRHMRIVALSKPNATEKGQWYFRRYIKQLPNIGEIVFFDRSWYNRAVVEPVMGFCTREEYEVFIRQVPEFEHMLFEDGVNLIKFWFSISKKEQKRRFDSRAKDPLKQWKLSPVDFEAQNRWDLYTQYKIEMLGKTHTSYAPWIIVSTDVKKVARLESIRYVLSRFPYTDKDGNIEKLLPDPNVVQRYYRSMQFLD